MSVERNEEIKTTVRRLYAQAAAQHSGCCDPGGDAANSCCCNPLTEMNNAVRLYTKEELSSVSADIPSFGCGNPIALSELQEGETVLDLGSGGGLDCFLAAQRVGPSGGVIGLDMTPEMINLARRNAQEMAIDNVEFRMGEMEHMPIESDSIDVIISNCVINLSPDKDAVFRESFRVLKPGGRLCVSDIVTHGELSEAVRRDLTQWACCISGALEESDYLRKIRDAGFEEPQVAETKIDPLDKNACCGGGNVPIASVAVKAYKPK